MCSCQQGMQVTLLLIRWHTISSQILIHFPPYISPPTLPPQSHFNADSLVSAMVSKQDTSTGTEVAEAMYYMHQLTGDPKYREWSHEILEAINKNAKVKYVG